MNLIEFEQHAWDLLRRAMHDRHSPLRNLTLATDSGSGPDMRILVLRGVRQSACVLELHTDIRSAKWQHLSQTPDCALLGWHPRHRLQIRIRGNAQLHHENSVAREAWDQISAATRLSYSAMMAPATRVHSAEAGQASYIKYEDRNQANASAWYPHFGVIRISVHRMELLQLGREGHLRAEFGYQGKFPATDGHWLVP